VTFRPSCARGSVCGEFKLKLFVCDFGVALSLRGALKEMDEESSRALFDFLDLEAIQNSEPLLGCCHSTTHVMLKNKDGILKRFGVLNLNLKPIIQPLFEEAFKHKTALHVTILTYDPKIRGVAIIVENEVWANTSTSTSTSTIPIINDELEMIILEKPESFLVVISPIHLCGSNVDLSHLSRCKMYRLDADPKLTPLTTTR